MLAESGLENQELAVKDGCRDRWRTRTPGHEGAFEPTWLGADNPADTGSYPRASLPESDLACTHDRMAALQKRMCVSL